MFCMTVVVNGVEGRVFILRNWNRLRSKRKNRKAVKHASNANASTRRQELRISR